MLAIDMLPDLETKLLVGVGLGASSFGAEEYGMLFGTVDSLFKRKEFSGAYLPSMNKFDVHLFLNAIEYFQANMVFGIDKSVNNLLSTFEKRLNHDYKGDSLIDTLHSTAWGFSLTDLVSQTDYIPGLEETKTLDQVAWELAKYRHSLRS